VLGLGIRDADNIEMRFLSLAQYTRRTFSLESVNNSIFTEKMRYLRELLSKGAFWPTIAHIVVLATTGVALKNSSLRPLFTLRSLFYLLSWPTGCLHVVGGE